MKYMYNCTWRQFFLSFKQMFKLSFELRAISCRVEDKISKNFYISIDLKRKFCASRSRYQISTCFRAIRSFQHAKHTIITTIEEFYDLVISAAFYAYTRSYFGNYNGEILFDFDDGHYFLIRLIHSLYGYVTGREIFPESIHLILKKENDIVCTQRF